MPRRPRGTPRPPSPSPLPPLPKAAPPSSPSGPDGFAEWQATLTPTELRIEQILDLMIAGRWLSGQTDKLLAKEWKVSPSYVRALSAESSRLLKRYVREDADFREEQRARLMALFAAIGHRAMMMGTPNGLKVALTAAELQGRYLGVEPPKQVVLRPRGEFEGMTDDELRAIGAEDEQSPDAADTQH